MTLALLRYISYLWRVKNVFRCIWTSQEVKTDICPKNLSRMYLKIDEKNNILMNLLKSAKCAIGWISDFSKFTKTSESLIRNQASFFWHYGTSLIFIDFLQVVNTLALRDNNLLELNYVKLDNIIIYRFLMNFINCLSNDMTQAKHETKQ